MGKANSGIRRAGGLSGLRQIIAGLTEGVILIDPDQTILWANDTALAMHGGVSLGDLGRTVTEYRERFQLRYRNNHPLEAGDYPIERVIDGEAFCDVVVEVARAGAEEPEWVHQVRSLVVTGEHGDPDYLVLILQDVSRRFEAEERFEQAFNANPAPALICRLSDLRFIKANRGFQEMTGIEREGIVGRTVFEFDIFHGASERELAKERLSERRTIPQMEAELALPGGGTRLVIVAGQTIEIAEEPCMLLTFADLEPRRKAEKALVQSEERFTQAFRLAPVAMLVASLRSHRVLDANQAFQAMTGYGEECFLGRSPGELTLWDTADTRRRLEQGLEAAGSLRNVDAKVRARNGELLDALVSAATISMVDDPCVLWVIQDITERRHSELELIGAIEAVMKDASWFSHGIVEKLANLKAAPTRAPAREVAVLTRREKEVLSLLCQGAEDLAIAAELSMSRATVRNHVARIYGKIGVNRRGAAIVWGRERGLAQGKTSQPGAKIR
ncbi:helix-turn-helix transcriptional regulator [Aureimonas populi]|uniref:PAS domain S-box protein n=1 Tax=Aureimonas populi TaxID=1701758 RepID=A0ABW5CL23_9HYPH|nr:helix-turn-helix transcriptional regulator [Aureimonas populi]